MTEREIGIALVEYIDGKLDHNTMIDKIKQYGKYKYSLGFNKGEDSAIKKMKELVEYENKS